ncbi:hypothetical protein EUGRSUZ_C02699 [Eucalyptus grandis]|uniref:Uncharacterized protein n=2 Tax=Eucalyptus grandis TaxID=71139 RepID=A0A059CSG5_EUCGR|nr:hypothetical protein EUGRSUZ_C02699 [Eucalyptus grandis]
MILLPEHNQSDFAASFSSCSFLSRSSRTMSTLLLLNVFLIILIPPSTSLIWLATPTPAKSDKSFFCNSKRPP